MRTPTRRTPAAAPIKRGDRFHSIIADSNALFEVTRQVGRSDVYEAKVIPGPFSDYAGTVKVFHGREIRARMALENAIDHSQQSSEDFWARQKIGTQLHYHNGFGNVVRGEVVLMKNGKKGLLPTALVGKWRPYDLPQRLADGSIHLGYHADKIAKGEAWQPHSSCVYESPDCAKSYRAEPDPRKLPALDLTPPAAIDTEREEKVRLIQRIKAACDPVSTTRTDWDPEAILSEVRGLLQSAPDL